MRHIFTILIMFANIISFAQRPQYANFHTSTYPSFGSQPLAGQTYQGFQFYSFNSSPHIMVPGNNPTISPHIGTSVTINRIYVKSLDTVSLTTYNNFTVKLRSMVDTPFTVVPSIRPYQQNSPAFFGGMNTVYGPATFTVQNISPGSWVPIDLDVPFVYDPAQEPYLIVEINHQGFTGDGIVVAKRGTSINSYTMTIYGNPPFLVGNWDNYQTVMFFGFDVLPDWDAGISGFHHPSDTFCAGLNPVEVIVHNAGLKDLDSVRIYWEVDNVPQPEVLHIGRIPSQEHDTITIGHYHFPFGASTSIKAWTAMPNGTVDIFTDNDTVVKSFEPFYPNNIQLTVSGNRSFCEGGSTSLSAGGASSYLWEDLSTGSNRTISSGGTYYLMAHDVNGCYSADTVVVTENPLPSVNLGGDQNICPRDNVTLTARNSQLNSYLWDDQSTAMSRTVQYAGTYWVRVTDPNGCQNSDTVRMTSPDPPSGSISVLERGNGRYDFSILNAYNVSRYIWNFGDSSPQDTGSNVSHTYADNGNYVVRATLEGICESQVRQLQQQLRVRTVGMEDFDLVANDIIAIPNPFIDHVSLQSAANDQIDLEVRVMDILGRSVFTQTGNIGNINKSLLEESPNWVPGMYVMQIHSRKINENQVLKISKSK